MMWRKEGAAVSNLRYQVYNIMGKINNEQRRMLTEIVTDTIDDIRIQERRRNEGTRTIVLEEIIAEYGIREKLQVIETLRSELTALGLRDRTSSGDISHGAFLSGSELMREFIERIGDIDRHVISADTKNTILSGIWTAETMEEAKAAMSRVQELMEES